MVVFSWPFLVWECCFCVGLLGLTAIVRDCFVATGADFSVRDLVFFPFRLLCLMMPCCSWLGLGGFFMGVLWVRCWRDWLYFLDFWMCLVHTGAGFGIFSTPTVCLMMPLFWFSWWSCWRRSIGLGDGYFPV
jgi:hypothetical protein